MNKKHLIEGKFIYNKINVKTPYYKWIKRCVYYADLKENNDFWTELSKSTGGRKATNYYFNIDSAKEICLVSATPEAKEYRRELIKLSNKREEGLLLTHEQFMKIFKMVKIFAIYEFRKEARDRNADNYVNNVLLVRPEYAKNKNLLYAKFNNWRNDVLKTGKEVLERRLKEYCLLEHKRLPAKFSQDEAFMILNEYENIRNAVWDLLSSQNKSEEMARNIADLAQEIAKEIKPFMRRLNESDMFFRKLDANDVKAIGL